VHELIDDKMAETESLQCQRPEELERDLQNLEGRDLQLWCLGGFISILHGFGNRFLSVTVAASVLESWGDSYEGAEPACAVFRVAGALIAAWHVHVPAKKAAADHQAGSDQASPSSGESGAHRCFDRTIQPPNP